MEGEEDERPISLLNADTLNVAEAEAAVMEVRGEIGASRADASKPTEPLGNQI